MPKKVATIQKEIDGDMDEFLENTKLPSKNFVTPNSYYMNSPDMLQKLRDNNKTDDFKQICDDALEIAEGKVLDFGGGIGTLARILKNRTNCEVHHYDINKYNREFAKFTFSKHNEEIKIHSSIFSMLSQRFDTILAIDVFENIKEYDDIITTLYNATKMGGVLAFTPAISEKFRDYKTFRTYMQSIGFKEIEPTTTLIVYRRVG